MTPSPPSSRLPAWVHPYLQDFEDLLRVIELSGGFVLQPIEVSGPDLARALADWLASRGHPAVIVEPQSDTEWETITGFLLEEAKPAPEGVVMVIGSRDPPDGIHLAMRLVNERRDRIGARLDRPLLWCGPPSFLQLTRERAPDFWSVRAVERRLTPAAPKPASAPRPGPAPTPLDLAQEARLQGDTKSAVLLSLPLVREALSKGRIAEADALLCEMPDDEFEVVLLHAEVFRRAGSFGLAASRLEAQLEEQQDPDLRCRLRLSLGRVDEAAGRLDRAENAYREAEQDAAVAGDRVLALLASVRWSAVHHRRAPEALLDALTRAVRLAEEQGDLALAALASALMAQATTRLHDRGRASKLLDSARDLAKRADTQPTILLPGEVEEVLEAAERAIEGRDADPGPVTQHGREQDPLVPPVPRPSAPLRPIVRIAVIAAAIAAATAAAWLVGSGDPRWCFVDAEGRILCFERLQACEAAYDRSRRDTPGPGTGMLPCRRAEHR